MILYINTTKNHYIDIALKDKGKILAQKKFEAKYSQAEKLLPEIEKLLKKSDFNLDDISKIEVENKNKTTDTSFTALRVGIITANALGYALGVKVCGTKALEKENNLNFDVIEPIYDGNPNIHIKK